MKNRKKTERKQKISYSFRKIMTGSDLSRRRLAIMSATSEAPGPVVWLTACVHGEEVGGVIVIHEIFRKLRKIPLLRGSVNAFPLMNPMGFENVSRNMGIADEDLNRAFPGNSSGSLAERVADMIFSTIMNTSPELVIDLHNDWIKSIPYVLIDPYPGVALKDAYDRTKHFARLTGFPVINEEEEPSRREVLRKTISGSMLLHGIPAITIELGEAYVVNEKNVADGFSSVWNILADMGMVAPLELNRNFIIPKGFEKKILKYSHKPVASTSGIIRFLVNPGQIVKAGDRIARIYNVFGKLQETITAAGDSIVLGHADYSVAMPGISVAAFGLIGKKG